ncbi:MAG: extracellular solute-binding protein [Alphaproteobacteria bacterium]|nr:extracellular solute-binding protein [Alphaproteobacteria bacterium]
MASSGVRRRRVVAGLSAAFVAAPFVRGAHAAGKLSMALWDHWVPNANNATETLVREWAEKEKVEVQIDFITSQGNKLLLTSAAESQAKAGHDLIALSTWLPSRYKDQLVPMNELMDQLIAEHGKVNATVEYLGKIDGKWLGVPATVGSQIKGPCSRIDYMKELAGIDVQAMYPAGSAPKADNWTFDTFLKAAEACHKGGHPFGIGLGSTADNVDTAGAIFHGFGAMLCDAKGNITVKSDPVRQALDYYKKLMQFLPADVAAWDDASNNKYLISGQGALIMNPPSAWAVAKRDAPKVAEQLWTHGFAAGPKGRFAPFVPFLWSVWNFSKNQSAAKSLLAHLSTARASEKMVIASGGYDLPSFEKLTLFKIWEEEGPPKGTLYHYPNPYNHQTLSVAAAPAPHAIAERIYTQATQTQMAVRYFRGEKLEATLAWAESEVEGFMRN